MSRRRRAPSVWSDEFGCRPLTAGAGSGGKRYGIARDAVIVGAAAEDVGVNRRVAAAGVEQQPLSQPLLTVVPAAFSSAATPPAGAAVGMRLLVTSTMPPTACEPKRSAAGPRMISVFWIASGSIGTPWSWPRSETSAEPTPFSWMRTRKSASPRRIGRRHARRETRGGGAGHGEKQVAEIGAGALRDLAAGDGGERRERHGGDGQPAWRRWRCRRRRAHGRRVAAPPAPGRRAVRVAPAARVVLAP